jgi:GNAT superfamily N-acetyltransferase
MSDMLVNLYNLQEDTELYAELDKKGIKIKRVLSPDREKVIKFVCETFHDGWANESKAAFANNPISCYIAVKNKKIIGFACYDATAKNFFGPTGVLEDERGQGIGKALLLKCLFSMKEDGYGYAIIGWVTKAGGFYEKTVSATAIENSFPGVYERLIDVD